MRIRVKEDRILGNNRIDAKTKIDNIGIKEDLLNPSGENIAIFFKGRDSSGIINLSRNEFESLEKSVRRKKRLIKTNRVIRSLRNI